MKLEKRNSGEGDLSPAQKERPAKSKPVVVYIMILFIAAFLLMALSSLMHQRSNTEALGALQNSFSAMQEVQSYQDKVIQLQEKLADTQEAMETAENTADQAQQALLDAQLETQALLALYTLQQQYSSEDYAACQQTIQEIEAAGYETLLPEKTEKDVTAPSVRFQQLKAAVEEKIESNAS